VQILGSPGPDSEFEKVTIDSNSRNGVSGVYSQLSFSTLGLPIRETEENPTGCLLPLKETYGVSQGIVEVCRKSHGFSKSHMAGSSTLQSLAKNDKLSCSTRVSTVLKFTFTLNLNQEARNDLNWWTSLDRHLIWTPLYIHGPQA